MIGAMARSVGGFLSLFDRFRRQAGATASHAPASIPRSQDEIARAAAAIGLTIPEACMPGVEANMALLARHTGTLRGPEEASGQ